MGLCWGGGEGWVPTVRWAGGGPVLSWWGDKSLSSLG